jgi:hypothetical protein
LQIVKSLHMQMASDSLPFDLYRRTRGKIQGLGKAGRFSTSLSHTVTSGMLRNITSCTVAQWSNDDHQSVLRCGSSGCSLCAD